MVLDGDLPEKTLAFLEGEAVLGEVAGRHHGKSGGRGLGRDAVAPGGHRTGLRQTRIAGVLELLRPHGEHYVVDAGGDRVGRAADGFRTGGALILHVGRRDVGELERGRHDRAGLPGENAPPPGRLDVLGSHACVFERFVGGIDDHVFQALVPVLAELDAAHADDGNLVFDAWSLSSHGSPPLHRTRDTAPAGFSTSSCRCSPCSKGGGRSSRAAFPP